MYMNKKFYHFKFYNIDFNNFFCGIEKKIQFYIRALLNAVSEGACSLFMELVPNEYKVQNQCEFGKQTEL